MADKDTELMPLQDGKLPIITQKDLLNEITKSTADVTEAYSNVPGGRIWAKKEFYPGGIQSVEVTTVPETDKKRDYKEAIKQMYANGIPMEEIARRLGISTSYAYQLARD